jgi:hypothetical protein
LPGARFLALVLQHVLPRGFRRARNFGFLHPNSKRSIALLHYRVGMIVKRPAADEKPRAQLRCRCCGAPMRIVRTAMAPRAQSSAAPPPLAAAEAAPVM